MLLHVLVRRGRRPAVTAAVTVAAAACLAACGAPGRTDAAPPGPSPSPGSSIPAFQGPAPATRGPNDDPAHFARQVVTHAKAAGISPRLLMAILYNESYKPHDPGLERAWQRIKPDSAFGVANMHRAAFDETKQGRDFAGRSWEELPDDPDLAVEAAAWYLHDLAAGLPAQPGNTYSKDELLAIGYNAGPGTLRTVARGTPPGPAARSYLDRLHANWDRAQKALDGKG
ncbi:transglycosylase SLT domain-containing protein [Streptomyces mashuensis]|uniref:transglycosylase SLT domain-containing protein n=1 Tax=Streptomyces mashuensis TaxID=33904 RepID=UPI001E28DB91|nr:transglycosylase SLT domain-containing protein [Streptomyces mashuensis]